MLFDALRQRFTGFHRVHELRPYLVVERIGEEQSKIAQRAALVFAQALGRRSEREGARRALGENSIAGQRPQHAIKRVFVDGSFFGQLADRTRAVGQQISDAQLGGDLNGRRLDVSHGHLHNDFFARWA